MPYSDQVDAGPARQHLRLLVDGGMSISQIQFASGVNRTSIRVILGDFPGRKPSVQIRAGTHQKILRTRLNRGSSINGLVPAVGTQRRLQALAALGHPRQQLAELIGMNQFQAARAGLIRAEYAQRVMAVYEELQHTAGPSSRAAEHARNRGWLMPGWWDDATIDDPLVQAEGTRSYDAHGRLVDDVTLARPVRVALMTKRGLSVQEIAARIGCRVRYVARDLSERPAVVTHLTSERTVLDAFELDEVAVDRFMAGTLRHDGRRLPPELIEAIRRLAARGLTDTQIAESVGASTDAVLKIRHRNSIPQERTA